ncbi:hypothetical protein KC219_23625, partial [Mycobacterium tuberculosis]|nr:hypothetical protein [Mycobacterium tuberculosis]
RDRADTQPAPTTQSAPVGPIRSLVAGWLHLQPKWKPSVSWFKNAESRLNHHLSGLFGVSSLARTGHWCSARVGG